MGRAKSYAERLFDFPEVGPLSPEAAILAIAKPAKALNVEVTRSFGSHCARDARLPLFRAGVGQAFVGYGRLVADHTG